MTEIIVAGGGVAGLAAAHALAESGRDVRVLERDPAPPPESVGTAPAWFRPTVPQSRHSHAFLGLGHNLLREQTPRVLASLLAAGAYQIALADNPPPTLPDRTARPGDEDLVMLACRRPVFEWVLRNEVERHPRVTFESGAQVQQIAVTGSDIPRVSGVRTADGRTLRADVVLNATGRRTDAARWLEGTGLRGVDEQVDRCEITYYTRFYRRLTAANPGPLNRGFGAGGVYDTYTAMLFLGDNDTFSISLGILPSDSGLAAVRHEAAFTAAVRATPMLAPWIADGVSVPISGVGAMSGLRNRLRIRRADRGQAPYGFYDLGDAACTTDPSHGRGISLALAHAFQVCAVLEEEPRVGADQAATVVRGTEELFTPWFNHSVQGDRARTGRWRAHLSGAVPLRPKLTGVTPATLGAAASLDEVVWRALVRVNMLLTSPASVLTDDDVGNRIEVALRSGDLQEEPAAVRETLVGAVSAAMSARSQPLSA